MNNQHSLRRHRFRDASIFRSRAHRGGVLRRPTAPASDLHPTPGLRPYLREWGAAVLMLLFFALAVLA